MPFQLRPNRRHVIGATALLALCSLAVLYGLMGSGAPLRPRIDNISSRPLACLAHDARSDAQTAKLSSALWTTMQQSGRKIALNVQQLQVPGNALGAEPYLRALVARHCTLIITTGPGLATAADTIAPTAPKQRFLLAGDVTESPANNVTVLDGSGATTLAAVSTQLAALR